MEIRKSKIRPFVFSCCFAFIFLIFFNFCKPPELNGPCDPNSKSNFLAKLAINTQSNYCNVGISISSSNFTLSGTITGLTRSGLVLSSGTSPNQSLTIASNSTNFSFPDNLTPNSSYSISITTQPLGNTCVVANGDGAGPGNVPNIAITCEPVNSLYVVDTVNAILYQFITGKNGILSSKGSTATALTIPYPIAWNGKHIVVNGTNTFKSFLRSADGSLTLANTYNATTTPVLSQGTFAFHSSGKFFYYTVNTGGSVTSFSKLQMDTSGVFSAEVNTSPGGGQNWTVMGPIHPTGNYFMTFHKLSTDSRRFFSITDLNTGAIGAGTGSNTISEANLYPENAHCIYSLNASYMYCANNSNAGNNGTIVQMSVTSISNALLTPPNVLVQNNTNYESPKSLILHPSGNYIFAYGNTNIYSYSVSQTTGLINPTPLSTVPTPGGVSCTTNTSQSRLAIHPDGTMLYAACVRATSSNNIGAYPISSTGVLSAPTLTLIPGNTSSLNLFFVPGD
jgi:6-phosphogluconolactonase